MQTILSKSGVEVRYPCTIHLLGNGEIIECEYKSDNLGRDLLEYVCEYQNLNVFDYWGLKYLDSEIEEQRYWLEMDKLIHSQVKHICPLRFHFRVKVYPLEPYKISDDNVRHQIFQQLRLDLLSGRLTCEVNDSAMLVGLLLQYVHADFRKDFHYNYMNYIKEKILRKERYATQFYLAVQTRSLEIYENLLGGLGQSEIKDLFLRMASKLDTYGVEAFAVESVQRTRLNLLINCNGLRTYDHNKKTIHIQWKHVNRITRQNDSILISLPNNKCVVFKCISNSECGYIWSIAHDNYVYYTTILMEAWNSEDRETGLMMKSENGSWITEIVNNRCSVRNQNFIPENSSLINYKMKDGALEKVNAKWWLSQLPLVVILVLYVLGLNSELVNDMPCFCSNNLNFHSVQKFLLNKFLLS